MSQCFARKTFAFAEKLYVRTPVFTPKLLVNFKINYKEMAGNT